MQPDRVQYFESQMIDSDSAQTPTGEPESIEQHHRREVAASSQKSQYSVNGLFCLVTVVALLLCIYTGPRLVQEYYYAASIGKIRAEHELASEKLSAEELPLSNVSRAYQLVAQKVRPSVVSVNAIKSNSRNPGLGSGIIVSNSGYIMTNAHVLEGANEFYVELYDRRQYPAVKVGSDTLSDLALLKINAPDLIAAEWGDSEQIDVGSIVWAVGSPYGYQQTVTSGIISGKDRPGDGEQRKQTLLQTDAAVNPGNSGGPLVDERGRVIGINTSIFGETFQGISFAVPSETAIFVYEQLKAAGKVTRGYLGVYPAAVNFRDAERMSLENLDGAKLERVAVNSPAHRAGFRRNDVIKRWNGIEIKEYKTLFRLAEMARPNSTIDVSFIRNGQERQTQVVLGTLPDF